MNNREVADILDQIGTFLELKGENPFKSRAYHNVSRIIGSLTTDLAEIIRRDELKNIQGVGPGIAPKITELVTTGRCTYYDELKGSLPPGLPDLLRISGLGPKKVKVLFEELHITGIPELREAILQHKLEGLAGFGEKTGHNILDGIEHLMKHADKYLYPVAYEAAEQILEVLRAHPGVIRCDIAGSLRRKKEIIGDIDILVSIRGKSTDSLMNAFTALPIVERVVARGDTKSSVVLTSGISCDLRVISDKEYPFALAYFTGSKEHNVELRSLALKKGWSLNEYTFSVADTARKGTKKSPPPSCKDEKGIYASLGLAYIPPELRENMGEIDAAKGKSIPKLVNYEDIRGTFHCHTTASDGTSTLEAMADAARALGWEYLGIADHSKAAAYARGLTEAQVKLQFREIDTLNKKLGGFRIFKGTEADILADGGIDFNDKLLAQFDYVVASVHSRFKMNEAEATKRIIKAIKNKYVTMLGHPTGRLLLEREGYPVNMIDVISAAADYGKIIEINAHPMRLDLDWRLCHFAIEKGVKICINPDAHSTLGLKDVQYGVNTARKGWCTAEDIVNTRSLADVARLLNHHNRE
jgi:DNA polymerase (family X)